MAEFIKGDIVILYIYDTVATAYEPVACLTSNSLSETRNIIESQTKCDPGLIKKDSGSYSYEISCEGQAIIQEADKYSHVDLHNLMISGDKFTWRIDTGQTVTDLAYYGTAILQDLTLDAAAGDELTTFTGTLSGDGLVTTTDPN